MEILEQKELGNKPAPAPISFEQSNIITEDLVTFVIVHHVLFNSPTTLESVKEYFSFESSLINVIENVIAKMEDCGLVSVEGGIIRATTSYYRLPANPDFFMRFIPSLFEIASKQILKDAKTKEFQQKKEAVHYTALPNTPDIAIKVQSIFEECRIKLRALALESEGVRSEDTRVVGVLNCLLDPKEFV